MVARADDKISTDQACSIICMQNIYEWARLVVEWSDLRAAEDHY